MCRFSFLFGTFILFFALGCGKKPKPAVASTPDQPDDTVVDDGLPKPADVIKKIKDKSPDKRMKGIAKAADVKTPAMIDALVDALNDASCAPLGDTYPERPYSTREAAVMALLQQGSDGEKAVLGAGMKALQKGLKDPLPAVQEHTAYALSILGSKAKPATDDLIALCSAKDKEVRRAAYTALEKIRTIPAMPIVQLLKNPDAEICQDAAETFSWLKPIPPEAVTIIIDVLKDDQIAAKNPSAAAYIRKTVAEALGKIGPRAQEAIPALIAVLKKTKVEELNLSRRPEDSGALVALRSIGKPAIPPLLPLLDDPAAVVRWQAINVLGGMGPDAKEALEPLQACLEKEFQRNPALLLIIADAAMAQVRIGGDTARALEKIAPLLKYNDPKIRQATVSVLGMMGRKAESAVPEMIALLDDPEKDVRLETAQSLRLMGPAAKAAIPALTKKLSDPDARVRKATVENLTRVWPCSRRSDT